MHKTVFCEDSLLLFLAPNLVCSKVKSSLNVSLTGFQPPHGKSFKQNPFSYVAVFGSGSGVFQV